MNITWLQVSWHYFEDFILIKRRFRLKLNFLRYCLKIYKCFKTLVRVYRNFALLFKLMFFMLHSAYVQRTSFVRNHLLITQPPLSWVTSITVWRLWVGVMFSMICCDIIFVQVEDQLNAHYLFSFKVLSALKEYINITENEQF